MDHPSGKIMPTLARGSRTLLHIVLVLTLAVALAPPLQARAADTAPVVLYRVNAGGPQLDAIDDGPDWEEDVEQYITAGDTDTSEARPAWDDTVIDDSVPGTTPPEVFDFERWLVEVPDNDVMSWEFEVEAGTETRVRLYLAARAPFLAEPGDRVFDVVIDGVVVLEDYDPVVENGFNVGVMEEFSTTSDGTVRIDFIRGEADSPNPFGIEILAVPPVNQAPVITPIGDQSAVEGEPFGPLDVEVTDPDDDPVTVEVTGLPDGLSFDDEDSTIAGTPAIGSAADSPYTVTVTASDGDLEDTATFSLEVLPEPPVNQAPVITPIGDQSAVEGEPFGPLDVEVTDPDDDPVTVEVTGLPDGLSFDDEDSTIAGTPAIGSAADSPYTVTVTASDGDLEDTATFSLTVTAAPEPGALSAEPSQIDLGTAEVGETTTGSTTVTNTGEQALQITGITITGPAAFSGTSTLPIALAPGASTSLSFSFTPSAAGSFTASVAVVHTGTNTPLTVSLKAEATSPPEPIDFTDVSEGNVHRDAILRLANDGIILGFDDGTYRPFLNVTRGQLSSILARTAGLEPAAAPYDFTDIEGSVHAGNIQALADAGIITGFSDGTFRPSLPVTRAQAASLIGRWIEVEQVPTGPFTDVSPDGVHSGYINALNELGIILGRTPTTFEPASPLQRGQTASIVARTLDVLEEAGAAS
jgi:hypothetical protein